MSKAARIIVGMDAHAEGSASAALGARLASRLDAALELYTPVYNSQVSLAHFEDRDRLQHARDILVRHAVERLEKVAAALPPGTTAECHAAWDHPAEEALIRRVLERGADMLVVALPEEETRGRRHWSAGHWQLVRHCPVPVLLTRGKPWAQEPVVVAAVDPVGRHARHADLEQRILVEAGALAAGVGGVLHAWHAWQPGPRIAVGGLDQPLEHEAVGEGHEARHREAVLQALQAAGVTPARIAVTEGRPEQALPDYCQETGADLVVMGAIARNPFGRIFLGSTAERVLDRLPCDLLVVKPESFRTPVSRERWPRDEAGPLLGVPGI
jgi:universal stress protein E